MVDKKPLTFSYDEVKHLLYVDFFDDSINLNKSEIPKKEFKSIVEQIPEIPFRIEHKWGIDNIKGHFTSGEIKDNHVFAYIDVQDTETQMKFKNGTYKIGEAGMSPAFNYDCTMTCNICGENYRECEHFAGDTYGKDKVECHVILSNLTLSEGSLTDSPAYAASSGKVLDIMFSKGGEKFDLMFSVNKVKKCNIEMRANTKKENEKIENKKIENSKKENGEMIMAEDANEKPTEEAPVETPAEEIPTETPKAGEETPAPAEETPAAPAVEDKPEASTEASVKTEVKSDEMAKLSARVKELETERFEMKSEARKVELLKYTSNDAVVKHILSKDMTDAQFSTELANIKILTQEHSVKGSATESKKVEDTYFKATYGVDTAKGVAASLLGMKI